MCKKYLTLWAAICLGGPTLAADRCDDLWVSRNAVFDAAGFCFQSPLGQALFDNGDCSTQAPDFTEQQSANIAAISQAETQLSCNVDVNRTRVDVPDLRFRAGLETQPIVTAKGRVCHGYIGRKVDIGLVVEADNTVARGVLRPGVTLILRHQPADGQSYAILLAQDAPVGAGWIPEDFACEAWSAYDWDAAN